VCAAFVLAAARGGDDRARARMRSRPTRRFDATPERPRAGCAYETRHPEARALRARARGVRGDHPRFL